MNLKKSISLAFFALSAFNANAEQKLGYFSSPTLHENSLVFTAEGDLWHTYTTIGNAKRLTTHASEELMASISPDGKFIAYSANYEGNFEAYLMPIGGGEPVRLTYENARVRVQGWSNDNTVIYATDANLGPANYWTLKTVNTDNLNVNQIPLSDAIEGSVDSSGKYLYFVRFGLQTTGDNSKVYRGGAKGQLWRYELGSDQEATPLSKNHIGSVREPMAHKDALYFISDASGSDNIWSMNFDGSNIKQVTKHADWEIRLASIHNDKIVYQLGADIHQLDVKTNQDEVIEIALTSDFPERQERWENNPLKYFKGADIAGNTEKAVITARGKLAVAGLHNTRLVEIDTPAKSRTRSAILSNDGKWVYAINDVTGENEIWRYATDGSKNSKQLTKDGVSFRWNLYLSPDGKYIAHDDRDGYLWLLNLSTGDNKIIGYSDSGSSAFDHVVWSADSKLIAFAGSQTGYDRTSIRLYSLATEKKLQLTSDKYESTSPAFSTDGNWLYFLSARHFKSNPTSPWGDRNMGPAFDKRTQIFAYPLTENAKFAFAKPTELDQDSANSKTDKSAANSDTKDNSKSASINKPLWETITDELYQVPVTNGNYSNLSANKSGLYFIDSNGRNKNLKFLKFDNIEPKAKDFASGVLGYELASNGKNLLLAKKGATATNLYIVKAGESAPKDLKKSQINANHWQMAFNPVDEWQQMFQDAWLMHREFLYDQNMRGLDWAATKEKYQPLVDRITARSELNDIFAQMMGELNSLHSQVRGGDVPIDATTPRASSLGAQYQQVKNGVQIVNIYQADSDLPSLASPLAKAGINVNEGDVITHINGKKVNSIVDIQKSLRNQAGKQILLTLERGKTSFKQVVVPATSRQDSTFRYHDWINQNQTKVAATDKNLGYLHMYAMTANDVNSFAREFYANINKDGLIIDVRRNRGGNIDSWLIEKLLRQVWMYWQERDSTPAGNMQQTFKGHLVVLTDQLTYSDGETFSAAIKSLGLAPLIGKQTTGAGVWLSGRNGLTDRGMARVAEFPVYDVNGNWVVEGHGVSPDIEVDNLPFATFSGTDAQLEAGIKYLTDKLAEQPIKKFEAKPMVKSGPAADVKKIK
ncbi:S41 family peptidase [Thalassotalea crassostreae]|uniref:S41 family peptidase n=1 Tax=Thalassotalea crassostreae TaxID=1763536 RepID=UPI000837C390|nr:S41 family peptidase [Thalassotalea crassostreae]